MRAIWRSGLVAATTLTLLLPAAASADSVYMVMADNDKVYCDLPLPSIMVSGELGTIVSLEDPQEIDKVTLATSWGAEIVDATFHDDRHTGTIELSADISAYVIWSCAPLNGEPVLQNDPNEV
jgi:hypothetical protein